MIQNQVVTKNFFYYIMLWTFHKQMEKVKLWLKFFLYIWLKQNVNHHDTKGKGQVVTKIFFIYDWNMLCSIMIQKESIKLWLKFFLLYTWLKHVVNLPQTKGKYQVVTKIFFIIYMTETKCEPSWYKWKVSSCD